MTTIRYTFFPTITDTFSPTPMEESWPDFVARFSTFRVTPDKFKNRAFGPYEIDGSNRCDKNVRALYLAVFDADQAQRPEDISDCDALLDARSTARLWYPSYSYAKGRLSFRLIIPLADPLDPRRWKSLRRTLIDRFHIPADVSSSNSLSHSYFCPAMPPGADYRAESHPGAPLNADAYVLPVERLLAFQTAPPVEPEEAPVGPVNVSRVRQAATKLAGAYAAQGQEDLADTLRRAVEGRAFAEPGHVHVAIRDVTFRLAHTAKGVLGYHDILAFLQPSIFATPTNDGGTKLRTDVQRLLRGAIDKRDQAKADKIAASQQRVNIVKQSDRDLEVIS